MAADGQPVWLIEQGGLERFVAFEDSELPVQGLEEVSTLRVVKTEYPGSTKGSAQVMGTSDGPFQVRGRSSDQLTGRVGRALELRGQLRALQKGQRFLEFRWGDVFSAIGLVTELGFPIEREADIEYRFTFDVYESFDAEVIASTPAPEATEAEALNVFRDTAEIIDATRDFLVQYEAYKAFRLGLRASTVVI